MAEDRGIGIGSPVARLEDERLLRGGGRYVSDLIATASALHVKVLRSPYAHAHLVAVDPAETRSMPGVVDVLTARDLTKISDLPCDWVAPGMVVVPQHPILARDRVRYVGEPVAAVAAETAHAAEAALAAIAVDYEQLAAVAEQETAIDERAPRLHDAVPGNIAFRFRRTGGHIDRAFAEADCVIRRRLTNNRVTAAPLEGRAVLSDFDNRSNHLTHYTSSQLPHTHARSLADCLGFPLHKLRLVAPDIGGGFGANSVSMPRTSSARCCRCALAAHVPGARAVARVFSRQRMGAIRSSTWSLRLVATAESSGFGRASSRTSEHMPSEWDLECRRSTPAFRSPDHTT